MKTPTDPRAVVGVERKRALPVSDGLRVGGRGASLYPLTQ